MTGIKWSIDDALRWAEELESYDGPPNGDVIALLTLAHEIRRLHDIIGMDGMKRVERLESALKVIGTWAGVDGALDAGHVDELVSRALGGER